MTDKPVRIRRAQHDTENRYFPMRRDTAQDRNLSYEARGVLSYLLSKPDDWEIMVRDLQQEGCGRDKVYRILKELETHRYLTREQIRVNGVIQGVEYVLYETPLPEKPDTALPDTANTEHTNNRIRQSTEKRVNRSLTTSAKRTTKKPQKPAASAPTVSSKNSYEHVPRQTRIVLINAWNSNLLAQPIGAFKADKNHETAADLYEAGITDEQIEEFVRETQQDVWWKGKTLTFQKVAELIPGWLAARKAAPSKVVGTIAPRFEDTPPADVQEYVR